MPIIGLIIWSFSGTWFYPALLPTTWTTEGWRAVVGGGSLGRAVGTSAGLGVVSGVVGCVCALVVGRALARGRGRFRHIGVAAVFLPVAAPPIALSTGLLYAFIKLGVAGTVTGVALAHLVPTIGFLSLYFFGVFTAYDTRLDEEARSLGATAFEVWLRVTLPVLRGQIALAVAMGFLLSWGQVASTLVIGGGIVHTLPLEVFAYTAAGQSRFAATAALLLSVPPLLVLAAAGLLAVQPRAAARATVMPGQRRTTTSATT